MTVFTTEVSAINHDVSVKNAEKTQINPIRPESHLIANLHITESFSRYLCDS